MAFSVGRIEEFDASTDNWRSYVERLDHSQEKNGSNQSFDFIKDFKSSVKSLCD